MADEPPGTGTQGARAVGCKEVPTPRGLGQHGWGKHPKSKGQGKPGHFCPGDGKGGPQVCKEVAGAHAGPSSAEEPPPACVQSLVERSSSLPPTAFLPAARSNFMCIVPTAAATIPCAPPRAPHSQVPCAPTPAPCITAPRTSLHTSQLISLMLCAPLRSSLQRPVSHPSMLAPPCPLCGCEPRDGMETAGPGWASTGHRDRCRAVDYSCGSCYSKVPADCSHPQEKRPSPAVWQHPWEGH